MVRVFQALMFIFLGFMALGATVPMPGGEVMAVMGFVLGVLFIWLDLASNSHHRERRETRPPQANRSQRPRQPRQAGPARKRAQEGELEEWP